MAGDDFSTRTLEEHRALIAEMLESSKEWPTDTHVLQASLTIAADTNLPGLGGLDVLADVLLEDNNVVRIQALRVLNTAAANNIKFQLKLLETESAAVPWLLQVVADAAYSEPCDAVLLVAAVRATASMSRNLPTAATGFMTAHIPHLDDDCTPPVSLPQSMQLLFDVAVRSSSACSETEEEEGSQPCRVHASVAKAAMGLISDLAANDEEARISLQGRYAVNVWIGLCEVVPSEVDLMERVVQLLQHMWEPLPEEKQGPKAGTVKVVPCLERLVAAAGSAEGMVGSLQLLLKWVGDGEEDSHNER